MTNSNQQWKRSIDNVNPIHDNHGNTTGYLACVTVTDRRTGKVYSDVGYSKINTSADDHHNDPDADHDQCVAAAVRQASQRCIRNAAPTFDEL